MNDRYEDLLRRSRDAQRGGRDAWAVQSPCERVAVALVLNRADWLREMGYTLPEAVERSGAEWVAMIPQVARQLRGGGKTMQIVKFHRTSRIFGITAALALVL